MGSKKIFYPEYDITAHLKQGYCERCGNNLKKGEEGYCENCIKFLKKIGAL